MGTVKLTVRLPKRELDLAKEYAKAHRLTVTELIERFFRSLRGGSSAIHPEVERISGLIPPQIGAKAELSEHAERKHRGR